MPDLVYGRRATREALRGRREVLELWASERAVAAEPWLAEAKPRLASDSALSERAGTRDHQGVVAIVEPYRYADAYELAAAERPLLAVLDRVTDPRNLGAVCRSAEGAGATGVVVPAHGSAVVTPAVARASAGAIEHLPVAVVTNLARYLGEVKGADLWVFGAAGEGGAPSMWETDLSGGARARLRGRGERPAPARPPDLRCARRDPARGQRRVAQRVGRGGGAALRGPPPAQRDLGEQTGPAQKGLVFPVGPCYFHLKLRVRVRIELRFTAAQKDRKLRG